MKAKTLINKVRKSAYHKRNQLNWSQEKAAEEAGVSVKVIRALENSGDPKLSSICAIFAALGTGQGDSKDRDAALAEVKTLLYSLTQSIEKL